MSATQHSSVAVAENAARAVLSQPRLLVRETLAGVVTAGADPGSDFVFRYRRR